MNISKSATGWKVGLILSWVSHFEMNVSTVILLLSVVLAASGASVQVHNADRPTIISRSEWGARPAGRGVENLSANPPPFVIIHHSATDGCTTRAICQARVRGFQNYHMDQKHWDDIGYNFLVGEDGNVYEGRGWGIKGAHSVTYNGKSIGICMIGNFQNREPQPAAINAVKSLIAYGVSAGKINPSYTLYGHRQTSSTDCPGTRLYELIQSWPHWQRN